MNRELTNRIITSLILLPVLVYSSYYSGFYFIIFLSLIYLIAFYEIIKNIKRVIFNLNANIIIIFSLYSFYYLRGETNFSLITVYWILTATFLSDIGGYTFGKIFKGKKLTKISPNKTYAGSIGSIICSLVSLTLLNEIQNFFFDKSLFIKS